MPLPKQPLPLYPAGALYNSLFTFPVSDRAGWVWVCQCRQGAGIPPRHMAPPHTAPPSSLPATCCTGGVQAHAQGACQRHGEGSGAKGGEHGVHMHRRQASLATVASLDPLTNTPN